jgi:hypothetical protein
MPYWPQIHNPRVSASSLLGWQVYAATMPGDIQIYITSSNLSSEI